MVFNTTQTTTKSMINPTGYNYFLKEFLKVYEIFVSGLWINTDIKQFWLIKPNAIK